MNQQQQVARIFDEFAEGYVERFMDVSLYAQSLDTLIGMLPANGRLVDLGCGPGNITRYLLDRLPALNITGVDLAPGMIEQAKVYNPEAQFRIADWREGLENAPELQGIIAGFLTPYLAEHEVEDLMQRAAQCMGHGGLLYLSTMEDDYSISGLKTNSKGEQLNMYFYTEKQLCNLAKKAGFELAHVDRKRYVYNDADVTDVVLILSGIT